MNPYGNMADHWLMVEYPKSKRVYGDVEHNRIGFGSL